MIVVYLVFFVIVLTIISINYNNIEPFTINYRDLVTWQRV